MIIIECDQGTKEWHAARAGTITASMFVEVRKRVGGLDQKQAAYVEAVRSGKSEKEAMAIAGYKAAPKAASVADAIEGKPVGDYTEAAKNYAFMLACERIAGEPLQDEQFQTFAMRRGNELEPEARLLHEQRIGKFIERAGFVLTDDHLFGASADGLIDNDGGSEYKCLVSPARIRSVLLDNDISEFMDQVQGCMWITGRKWWHFALYCPALKPIGKELTIFPIERDDNYIEALEADLIEFEKLVTLNESLLRQAA